MINICIVLGIILIHWIADFVCQSDADAKGKSSNWINLLSHTGIYTLIWIIPVLCYGTMTKCSLSLLLFLPITFICHTATDYYTSKVNSLLWKENKMHEFFVSIGFDQVLHYVQLLLTFYLLIK